MMRVVLAVLTLFLLPTSTLEADNVDLINLVGESQNPQSATENKSTKRVTLAQKPKTIINLSDERIRKGAVAGNASVSLTSRQPKPSASSAAGVGSNIDRQMSSLQRSIKLEETKLEAALQRLGDLRAQALEKSDEARLNQIEAAEKQAVVTYQRRIERLIQLASSGKPRSVNGGADFNSSHVRRYAAPQAGTAAKESTQDRKEPRRRFRLWPFR